MVKADKSVNIAVQVHPGAKRNEIMRFQDGIWHVKIAAPPVEGKANKELINFLSEILDVSKSRIVIEKGTLSHKKLVVAEGLTEEQVQVRMEGNKPTTLL